MTRVRSSAWFAAPWRVAGTSEASFGSGHWMLKFATKSNGWPVSRLLGCVRHLQYRVPKIIQVGTPSHLRCSGAVAEPRT